LSDLPVPSINSANFENYFKQANHNEMQISSTDLDRDKNHPPI